MMGTDFDEREPSLDLEEVERRGEPRGIMRDMAVTVEGTPLRVLEASRKGVFVTADDPDSYRLGALHDIEVSRKTDGISFQCRAEVTRKEIHPRKGVVFRIIRISPVAEETFKQILGEA